MDSTEQLVSDVAITRKAEHYADYEMMKNDGESYSTHLGGYEAGAKGMRTVYEPKLSSLQARVKELEEWIKTVGHKPFCRTLDFPVHRTDGTTRKYEDLCTCGLRALLSPPEPK